MNRIYSVAAIALLLSITSPAGAEVVRVSVQSVNGQTYNTPVFAGFHDGTFDLFDPGAASSVALERLAEDGNNSVLGTAFADAGFVGGTIGGGPFGPGETVSMDYTIDLSTANRLLVASMVLPTNDWFLGSGDPDVFDISALAGGSLTFDLRRIYDAGTEVNDFNFSAGNPLLSLSGGQTGPNLGTDENGVNRLVGTIGGNGEVISPTGDVIASPFAGFANLPDGFNPSLSALRITITDITAVPEPASLFALAAIGTIIAVRQRRRGRRRI